MMRFIPQDSVRAATTVKVVNIPIVQGPITFHVLADTSFKVIQALLQQAQDPNNRLEVVPRPRGGLSFDPKLNIMVKQ